MAARRGEGARYSAEERQAIRQAARNTTSRRVFLARVRDLGVRGRDAVLADARNDVLDADFRRDLRRQGLSRRQIEARVLDRERERFRSVNVGERKAASRLAVKTRVTRSRNRFGYEGKTTIVARLPDGETVEYGPTDILVSSPRRLGPDAVKRRIAQVSKRIADAIALKYRHTVIDIQDQWTFEFRWRYAGGT